MRMLVLGAGLQGSACAYDLLQQQDVASVTVADVSPRRVAAFLTQRADKRLTLARLDAKNTARLRTLTPPAQRSLSNASSDVRLVTQDW